MATTYNDQTEFVDYPVPNLLFNHISLSFDKQYVILVYSKKGYVELDKARYFKDLFGELFHNSPQLNKTEKMDMNQIIKIQDVQHVNLCELGLIKNSKIVALTTKHFLGIYELIDGIITKKRILNFTEPTVSCSEIAFVHDKIILAIGRNFYITDVEEHPLTSN